MKQALVVALLLAGSLLAQRHGGGGGGARVGPIGHGFGNVLFPGTGIPNPVPGHATGLGAAVRGVYPGGNGRGFYRPQQPAIAYPIAVPVPVPVPAYGYDYAGFAPQMPVPQPYYPQPQQPPPPQQPTVIINQHYTPDRAQPVMREYSSSELGSYQAPVPDHPAPPPSATAAKVDDDTPTVYLIALKDGTVYSAYAYWVEGDTLHYITTKHSHNRASVTLVDSELSNQLNRERKVDFKLRSR